MARNLPGLDFMFAICDVQELRTLASQFGSAIEVPEQGQVHLMARTPATSLVASAFAQFADLARSGVAPTDQHGDVVLHAMTHALMDQERTRRIGRSQRIDSRRVVLTCIDFAESVGRIPSIAELCAAAHLSERRLREAFTEEYGMPPTRFFRAWALGEAHRRLAHCDPGTDTVTQVAADLGFDHLGRFSGHYREIFEEHPSQTLNAD
jgi:AraC-like DNA-binding protein